MISKLPDDFLTRMGLKMDPLRDALGGALELVKPDGPWLAGGALRRLINGDPLKSDFDFFFASEQQADAFVDAITKLGARKKRESEGAHTYEIAIKDTKRELQVIRLAYYADLTAVLDSFDWTICQFGFDGGAIWTSPVALWDLARRRLSLHRVTYAAATARRAIKYTHQGFTLCQGAIVTLLQAVAEKPALIHAEIVYVD